MTDFAAPSTLASTPSAQAVARIKANGPAHCIEQRPDGVYADPEALGTTLLAALDGMLRAGSRLVGVDYPVLTKALYGHGPELARGADGRAVVRLAADIAPFPPARRALYRKTKVVDGQAEYYFEPVFEAGPGGGEHATRLDADEFMAHLWSKGIRFGVDLAAVNEAIESGAAGRVVVARRLEPQHGVHARMEEVTGDLHRSDAPRQLANGKLDLLSFQNRFPQIAKGKRLLRKVPGVVGTPGFDLAGVLIPPEPPNDLDLSQYAGDGTEVARLHEGEFLIARQDGFLNVDPKSSRISVNDKIISRDGVSARTTGNLHLSGDYEEFGDVQEQRIIEGGSITVHADVYGHLVSRGGAIRLDRNLIGGSARNQNGPVHVRGVASNAIIQTASGDVVLQRAENCVISGTRVRVEQAINCDIIGDDVEVSSAEGCAIAGRRVTIARAAPWRQGEMLVYVLRADCARIDDALTQVRERVGQFARQIQDCRAAVDALSAQADLRKYLTLAPRVRSGQLVLTSGQAPAFARLGAAVTPALKELARLSQQGKAAESEQQAGMALLARLQAQRSERMGDGRVAIHAIAGDIQVRAMAFEPDAGDAYDRPARDIKLRLRDTGGTELLHADSSGSWTWSTGMAATPEPEPVS